MLRLILIIAFAPFIFGCSVMRALDFGGDPGKQWEFRLGLEHGIESASGKPGTTNPSGEYVPETPEVDALLGFPDVHAGLNVVIQSKPRISPVIGIEACEFKVPYLRWFSVQVQGGTDLVDVYIGKRLLSVFEISVGPWVGWDFSEDRLAFGVGGTLIKF